MPRPNLPIVVLMAAFATPALAQAPVTAQNAWARATPPGAPTAVVYVTLTSSTGDRLIGATSPEAATTGVHEMHMEGTIMRMGPVADGLELPAGKPVSLQPGGYHLMMEGLKGPLKQGQTVSVHLTFQKAPPLDITAPVLAIGARGPAPMTMPMK